MVKDKTRGAGQLTPPRSVIHRHHLSSKAKAVLDSRE